MSKIRIMADSASDVSQAYASELDVSVIPVNIMIGDENFKDGVSITSDDMFKKMLSEDILPKTSQPSPEDFMDEFKKYSDHTDIICLCLTSQGSGTYNSACLAKKLLEEDGFKSNIHIFDTLNASIPILEMVKIAKQMADDGKNALEIVEHLEFLRDKMVLYFVCDTLEYIRKGGRIGNVKFVVGTLLKIKPILTFIRGIATDVGKIRGIEQARRKLVELFEEKAHSFTEVTIVHAFNLEQAKKLENDICAKFKNIKVSIYQVGTSIGTYTGPGAFGIVFREKAPRW